MQLVYFEQQISEMAPGLIGAFCVDPGAQWVTFTDITAALDRGESVAIRPASASEKTRVESVIALSKIADQLAAKIGGLLDCTEPAIPGGAATTIAAAEVELVRGNVTSTGRPSNQIKHQESEVLP